MKRVLRVFSIPGLLLSDLLISLFAAYAGIYIRFDGNVPAEYLSNVPLFWILSALVLVMSGIMTGCYFNVWERASISETVRQMASVIFTYTVMYIVNGVTYPHIPRGSILVAAFISLLGTVGIRLSFRIFVFSRFRQIQHKDGSRILIIGAGDAGTALANHLISSNDPRIPIGFIDDDQKLWNRWIHGIPVFGGRECLKTIIVRQKVREVIIATGKIEGDVLRDIFEKCKETRCRLKRYETLKDVDENDISTVRIRDVSVEELLGRDPVTLDMEEVKYYIGGRTVLVTGGAGSIGSEICRQVLAYGCRQLVIFDFNENGLFYIDNELSLKFGRDRHQVVLGSIRDIDRLEEVFRKYKPDEQGLAPVDLSIGTALIQDYREIAKSRLVASAVIDELGLDGLSPDALSSKIDVFQKTETRVIEISVRDSDPYMAMIIANKTAEVFQEKVVEIMQVKNVQVIDKAELPEYPVSPNKKFNLVIAFIFGLAAGAGIVYLTVILDNTVKSPEDIEKYAGLTVIGTIPTYQAARKES